jgi:hypothetical protein
LASLRSACQVHILEVFLYPHTILHNWYLNELSDLQNRSMKLTYRAGIKYDTYDVKKSKILNSEKLNEDRT